jgi:hypothetical protein
MNNISISQNKWTEVYNSIVLLLYFSYEYKNNPSSIQEINDRYNAFCVQNKIVGVNFHFEGGATMLSFCYLIIVRIIEIVNKAAGSDGHAKLQFFEWVFETAKRDGIMSFDDVTAKYNIHIHAFSCKNERSDGDKLYQMFRHLRHSVSHYSYEIDLSGNNAKIKSINPQTKNVELDMSVPMFQLLNLTSQFGRWVNNTLHERSLLS